jgi:2-polyprenyl-3-methyl-5-hydroxy-6-metoxy-1,4-benzoquinol methylase
MPKDKNITVKRDNKRINIFFARGMDGLHSTEILSKEQSVCSAIELLGMTVINRFRRSDNRRKYTAGLPEILTEDLDLLEQSDFLIADLSLKRRSYIGAIFEITRAYELGKKIHIWTGDSGNEHRLWLQYCATSICRRFEELIEILSATYTREGRLKYRAETIVFYSDRVQCDTNAVRSEHKSAGYQAYRQEQRQLAEWVSSLKIAGTVLDIGSGDGPWIKIWARSATRVICVDASSEALEISRKMNAKYDNVDHIQGDFLDTEWLQTFLSTVGTINTIVLSCVLGLFTFQEENRLLTMLQNACAPGAKLIVLDSQKSFYSNQDFFTRTEIQRRPARTGERVFAIYKRNFLSSDLRRILSKWGKLSQIFSTKNYLTGGVAHRYDVE